jgi:uncharacterized protein (DUF1800 family)
VEAARFAEMGLEGAVDELLGAPDEAESISPPALRPVFDPEKMADIQTYWLHRMVSTRYPLVEKMTLFWHGHFATAPKNGASVQLMQRQNDLFRRHALGAFPALLREMGKDAPMLIWLDGTGSLKRSPNENYAREVMELFTTGPGIYTEQDVLEAARAFTGWRVHRETGEVTFQPRQYDGGVKSFLGRTGKFGADEIAAILSSLPETANFLSSKLWRFFASPTPDAETVSAMANAYLRSGGQIRPVLRTLFLSDAFYGEKAMRSLVKSPVEFVAGTARLLGMPTARDLAALSARMGQELYRPPSVEGWKSGPAWLGAATLLIRWNYGETVRNRMGQRPRQFLQSTPSTPKALVDAWLQYFGLLDVSSETKEALLTLVGSSLPTKPKDAWELTRTLVRAITAAPEYQLA